MSDDSADLHGGLQMATEAVESLQRTAAKTLALDSSFPLSLQHKRLIRDLVDAATLANGRAQDVSASRGGQPSIHAPCTHSFMPRMT